MSPIRLRCTSVRCTIQAPSPLAGRCTIRAPFTVQRHQKGEFTGLADIADYLDRHREKDEDQIRMTFQFLLHYAQLMPAANDPNVIDMALAIINREVTYFFCPTMGEATTARQIAGLGIYTLVNAAMQLAAKLAPHLREQPLPHIWMFIDEFQEIVGKAFAAFLAQAAKHGISAILANQTTNQLETKELSIADIVRDNTLAKLYFTVTGKRDIEELQGYSGDDRETLKSRSSMPLQLSMGGERIGTTETIVPKLRKDEILDTSATFGQFFAVIDDGKGHREPARVQAKHRFSVETFRRLRNTPLKPVFHPEPENEDHARTTGSPIETLWQRARKRDPDQTRRMRLEMISRLISAKKRHEQLS
ncbi:MAG: type IV secretion system DNA-binding domain-containing protein [Planctomycetaceae bacterium]|nr:type IV secretion system DNA-binding domain-containing protein [Planctomycetaceae bacterium]